MNRKSTVITTLPAPTKYFFDTCSLQTTSIAQQNVTDLPPRIMFMRENPVHSRGRAREGTRMLLQRLLEECWRSISNS
jgi:hypothetical protein